MGGFRFDVAAACSGMRKRERGVSPFAPLFLPEFPFVLAPGPSHRGFNSARAGREHRPAMVVFIVGEAMGEDAGS